MKTNTRIHWTAAEIAIVRNKVLEIISNRKMPRSSWCDVFEAAQRDLPIQRRRDHVSLNPNVWMSAKTGVMCSNTTQIIALSVLRELGQDVRDNVRVSQYSHYITHFIPRPEKKVNDVSVVSVVSETPINETNGSAERIATKLVHARQEMINQILQHEKEMVLSVASEHIGPMEQRIKDDTNARINDLAKTVEYLGQQISLITEFITSHGYKPMSNVNKQ